MHRFPLFCRGLAAALLCLVLNRVQAQLPPIGSWREHLSYHHALSISGVDNSFFVASPDAVFNVSGPDNTITRYTTINGLHSAGVSAIQSDPTGRLVIGYANSDVDIVSGASVTEVPDLELSPITGDKTIHSIYILGDNAYLATGLGIVVVNTTAYNIAGTYIIGAGGNPVSVYAVAADDTCFYAATAAGLQKAYRTASNLEDFNAWQLPVGDTLMGSLPCQAVVTMPGEVYVLRNDSLFSGDGNGWRFRYTDGWNISGVQVGGSGLILSEQNPSTATGRVMLLDTTGAVVQTLEQPGVLVDPRGVFKNGPDTWVADAQRGLLDWNGTGFTPVVPNSPDGPLDGQMQDLGSALWVAGGGTSTDTSGFYRFQADQWTGYNSVTQPLLKGIQNIVSIAVSPLGDTVYAGSATGGLIVLSPKGTITVSYPGSPITGLTFDSTGNLWMINSGSSQPLLERKPDGSILKYALPVAIPGNQLGQVIVDRYNYIWIVAPAGYGALCFNPATGQWKPYLMGTGQGNLPGSTVSSIVCDHQGLVWIGTNNGIGVIECGAAIFSGGCDATLPVVQTDAFAGYLFQGQQVLSIAVDGADRKWVGTTTGAWLISEDGEQVITNLTTQNSPLFNDTVNVTGIDGTTGEVFFSTPGGMCSYRSTATEPAAGVSGLLVFPNPVPPNYSGTIAIRGVPDAAIVKITELNGRLVYQTGALGGQAVWNGNDYTGRRVASGVYLVLIADQNNQTKASTKIVFIH